MADTKDKDGALDKMPGADPSPDQQPELERLSAGELQARQLQSEADTRRAREMRMDETVPGGKYVVDGQFVDAEGKPVK